MPPSARSHPDAAVEGLQFKPVRLDLGEVRGDEVVDRTRARDQIDTADRGVYASDRNVAGGRGDIDVILRTRGETAAGPDLNQNRIDVGTVDMIGADGAITGFNNDFGALHVHAARRDVGDETLRLDLDVAVARRHDVVQLQIVLRTQEDETIGGRGDRTRWRDRDIPALRDQHEFHVGRAAHQVLCDRRNIDGGAGFRRQNLTPLQRQRRAVDGGDRIIRICAAGAEGRAIPVRIVGRPDKDTLANRVAKPGPGAAIGERDRAVVRHVAEINRRRGRRRGREARGAHGARAQQALVGRIEIEHDRRNQNLLALLGLQRL